MINRISFPGLGINLEVNRVVKLFNTEIGVFGRSIYWYAVIIAFGFILAVWYGIKRSKQFGTTDDEIMEMLLFAVPSAIIFARLYYVAFEFDQYRDNLIEILYIWNGGIAIYGAIIGSVIGALIYCKIKKISIVRFFDLGALGFMIGQSIGRWGNFVNAEAFGGKTDLPWRMVINGGVAVHPTFLYESLWNALGFVILHFYSKKRKFNGEIFVLYAIWYGIGRAIIEGLRTDSLYLFNTGIRVSQALAIACVVFGVAYLIYRYKKLKKDGGKRNECSDN